MRLLAREKIKVNREGRIVGLSWWKKHVCLKQSLRAFCFFHRSMRETISCNIINAFDVFDGRVEVFNEHAPAQNSTACMFNCMQKVGMVCADCDICSTQKRLVFFECVDDTKKFFFFEQCGFVELW